MPPVHSVKTHFPVCHWGATMHSVMHSVHVAMMCQKADSEKK